jgi:glycosyltransferase involved in cell wall biosynthesis
MKILVLTSRYTATRDIIGEDFGRQVRLFEALRKLGHTIDFFVADYRKFERKNTSLHGIRVFIRPFSILRFFSFAFELGRRVKAGKYDLMIATSDPLWGIIGYIASKVHGVKFLYDLHDNYETYATYKIPFFSHIDNFVIRNSDLVTVVSNSLKDKIRKIRRDAFVVENGVDLRIFKQLSRSKCRQELGLPQKAKIIAYTGSLQRLQGIHLLVRVFSELKREMPRLHLVVSGRFVKGEERHINLGEEGIIYKGGSLPQKDVVKIINAADVVVIPNLVNDFTKYCFPYKVVEYMACNANIVATNVGDVGKVLSACPACLCKPNSVAELKRKIKMQLNAGKMPFRDRDIARNYSWDNIAKKLDRIVKNAA